jgi:hypothetical protein
MHRVLRRYVFIVLFACLAAGCAGLKTNSECLCATSAKTEANRKQAPELSAQRLMLSEGYSLLYADAAAVDLVELILYAKVESDEVDAIVTSLAKFGGELKIDLERIAKDYPGVRINLNPLPEMEQRKRSAIGKDSARYFAPVIGHGGREYERTVLMAFSNGINHERHLCQVMAEEEPDAGLKEFLINTKGSYDGLYDRTLALLEREYFKDPDSPTKD